MTATMRSSDVVADGDESFSYCGKSHTADKHCNDTGRHFRRAVSTKYTEALVKFGRELLVVDCSCGCGPLPGTHKSLVAVAFHSNCVRLGLVPDAPTGMDHDVSL